MSCDQTVTYVMRLSQTRALPSSKNGMSWSKWSPVRRSEMPFKT